MHLLIDGGNSRAKWVLHQDGQFIARGIWHYQQPYPWAELPKPQRVLFASVANPDFDQRLARWLYQHWQLSLERVQAQAEQCGVRCAYAQPHTLGVDRWLALLGARQLGLGDCCLIDCGTAVTVDLLRQDGQHLGGVIFPGAQLMRQALYQNTQRIPAEESLFAGIAGQTTRDCVAGGTTQAVIGALEHICAQARLQLSSQLQCVITGGGAQELLPYLSADYQHQPDLIFHGLRALVLE